MSLIGKWITSYLYGRAVMRFYQQRYKDTVRLLEKVRKLDPDNEQKELFCSYLGRSYLALERYDDALEMMSLAYELFRKKGKNMEEEFESQEFKQFLNAYIELLKKVGQTERAQDIAREQRFLKETTKETK
jgi:tetratricopeptide (TPR) repeat protein